VNLSTSSETAEGKLKERPV